MVYHNSGLTMDLPYNKWSFYIDCQEHRKARCGGALERLGKEEWGTEDRVGMGGGGRRTVWGWGRGDGGRESFLFHEDFSLKSTSPSLSRALSSSSKIWLHFLTLKTKTSIYMPLKTNRTKNCPFLSKCRQDLAEKGQSQQQSPDPDQLSLTLFPLIRAVVNMCGVKGYGKVSTPLERERDQWLRILQRAPGRK